MRQKKSFNKSIMVNGIDIHQEPILRVHNKRRNLSPFFYYELLLILTKSGSTRTNTN